MFTLEDEQRSPEILKREKRMQIVKRYLIKTKQLWLSLIKTTQHQVRIFLSARLQCSVEIPRDVWKVFLISEIIFQNLQKVHNPKRADRSIQKIKKFEYFHKQDD